MRSLVTTVQTLVAPQDCLQAAVITRDSLCLFGDLLGELLRVSGLGSLTTRHKLHLTNVVAMQTLMDQAAWNLCPVSGVSSGTACYYADDQTFTDLTGAVAVTIDDCPDGEDLLKTLPCQTDFTCLVHQWGFCWQNFSLLQRLSLLTSYQPVLFNELRQACLDCLTHLSCISCTHNFAVLNLECRKSSDKANCCSFTG